MVAKVNKAGGRLYNLFRGKLRSTNSFKLAMLSGNLYIPPLLSTNLLIYFNFSIFFRVC